MGAGCSLVLPVKPLVPPCPCGSPPQAKVVLKALMGDALQVTQFNTLGTGDAPLAAACRVLATQQDTFSCFSSFSSPSFGNRNHFITLLGVHIKVMHPQNTSLPRCSSAMRIPDFCIFSKWLPPLNSSLIFLFIYHYDRKNS